MFWQFCIRQGSECNVTVTVESVSTNFFRGTINPLLNVSSTIAHFAVCAFIWFSNLWKIMAASPFDRSIAYWDHCSLVAAWRSFNFSNCWFKEFFLAAQFLLLSTFSVSFSIEDWCAASFCSVHPVVIVFWRASRWTALSAAICSLVS